ncbi:hypothetical protein TWF102_001991 [Orbilia oligospora]|uniref:N-acetyltransferase domain-containing protein n=1 Tax=Orbilia oligospora TaxID=2813651 RepID=A0A7C8J0S8_ORBOL|nr:hypothetical protein TWF102_001991 [Orbilia oligospora]KAF3084400.1 hypothetical protein TWF103_002543 [Orbilia oligospora]KAF3144476.1 hypothetical protein TWF594_004642 [Orbilia oligospora]
MAPQSSSSGHAAVSIDGTSKIPRQGSADSSPSLIVQTNSLSLEELKSRFLGPSLLTFATNTRNGTLQSYNVELFKSSTLPPEVFDNCFDLLEANMSAAYKATSRGWNPRKKREEMKHPAMRYLVLTVVESGDKSSFVGFLEFMITEEEDVAEEFGRRVGVEKAMLTVFDSNKGARRFYEREGYDLDEISPEPKVLRNGTIKPSTYHILSKAFWADEDGEDDDENDDEGGDEDEDE